MAEIISIVVASASSSVLVLAIGAWLGKVWANRIAETERARNAREIEQLRSELSIMQTQRQRVSDARFELYNNLWSALQDLKSICDRLWDRADVETMHFLRVTLDNARLAVNRGRLILDEQHYTRLNDIMNTFSNYMIGKQRLIDLRSREELEAQYVMDSDEGIRSQVRSNAQKKNEYEQLLNEIVDAFRNELGISQ